MSDMYMDAAGTCSYCGIQLWAGHPRHECSLSPDQLAKLTFDYVIKKSLSRSTRWHNGSIDKWSISDWAVALAGEVGELCNAVKKLNRIETGAANINSPGRQLETREAAIIAIAEELADVFLYMPMLAARIGVDLRAEIVKKFNATSAKYNFPEKL